jgi:hypothetical protein
VRVARVLCARPTAGLDGREMGEAPAFCTERVQLVRTGKDVACSGLCVETGHRALRVARRIAAAYWAAQDASPK